MFCSNLHAWQQSLLCIIMSSIVEAIVRQAQNTFSRSLAEESFTESLSRLTRSVKRVRASDLHVTKDLFRSDAKRLAPVIYIEVTENKTFSMGIFLLRSGARIPLHDHPGMHGVLKVLFGTVKITSYSLAEGSLVPPAEVVRQARGGALKPVEPRAATTITERDEPCVLSPREGNFHEIAAVGGTAAFLDILAPPYDMKERDCHYYQALTGDNRTWLLRTPSPVDFWCESAQYTGPSVEHIVS